MMVEDRGKDEISAQNLMKKHETLELAVEDYAETIRQLGETVRQLTAEQHASRYVIIKTVRIGNSLIPGLAKTQFIYFSRKISDFFNFMLF